MSSPLERLIEDVALRLAAAPGGVPALALVARLPIPAARTLDLLTELRRRGVLDGAERDGIVYHVADGTPSADGACPGCGAQCPRDRPLCSACLARIDGEFASGRPAEIERMHGERAVIKALAAAGGVEVTLPTLAASSTLTAAETESLMTRLAARGAVVISPDPARVAWRPPIFEAPESWDRVFVASRPASAPSVLARVTRHHRKIVLGTGIVLALTFGFGYLRLTRLRKSAANAYWQTFFTLKHHEELLARYVDRVPGLDAVKARADLASMAELDVVPRLRRDELLHQMIVRVHAGGTQADAGEVSVLLGDFERMFAAQRGDYDRKAVEYSDALRGFPGAAVAWLFHFRDAYDPIPDEVWSVTSGAAR